MKVANQLDGPALRPHRNALLGAYRHRPRFVEITLTDLIPPNGFLRFSDAVSRQAQGMWGGLRRPIPVRRIKGHKQYKNVSVVFAAWKEQAKQDDALVLRQSKETCPTTCISDTAASIFVPTGSIVVGERPDAAKLSHFQQMLRDGSRPPTRRKSRTFGRHSKIASSVRGPYAASARVRHGGRRASTILSQGQ